MQINLAQIIFQAINFLVVAGALTFLLYKPVLKILDQRAQKIADAQKAASETLAEKEKLEAYKSKIKKATEQKAQQILAEAKDKAKQKEKELLAEAKKKAQTEIESLKKSWQTEKKQEIAQLKRAFSKSVQDTTKKLLGKALDSKKHAAIIDSELDALLKII